VSRYRVYVEFVRRESWENLDQHSACDELQNMRAADEQKFRGFFYRHDWVLSMIFGAVKFVDEGERTLGVRLDEPLPDSD